MSEATKVGVHWSFWVIGAVGLVFNLMGCLNYVSQMNAESVSAMPEAYRAIVESRPAWGTAAFAIAVFGGSLGCVLLLFRRSAAIYVLIVALVAAVLAQLPFLTMADLPGGAWIGWLSQVAVGAFLTWYSMLSRRKSWIS